MMSTAERIGLIGYGAIGCALGDALEQLGETAKLVGVLVRPGRKAGPFRAVHDTAGLIGSDAQLIVECAGHRAVAEHGPPILAAGIDLMLASTGVLADPSVAESLRNAASGGGRLLMTPGAVGGLDGLLAARFGGLRSVTYTSAKPPRAWIGTAAEDRYDLADPQPELLLFEGTAREAAIAYPRNANVAVAVALCGVGLDKTVVRLVSSREITQPLGVIEAQGDFGHFRFETLANASPENPKTSLLTAYSLLHCARMGVGLSVIELLEQ